MWQQHVALLLLASDCAACALSEAGAGSGDPNNISALSEAGAGSGDPNNIPALTEAGAGAGCEAEDSRGLAWAAPAGSLATHNCSEVESGLGNITTITTTIQ